jgi:hypothetical protein
MTRSFSEFGHVITAQLSAFGDAPERSTNLLPKRNARAEGNNVLFWSRGGKDHWPTARTAAYLAAYVDFAGSSRIPAAGLETLDGYVWLDRGVMGSLLAGGCVEFRGADATFELTEKGKALIAPFVPPSRYEGAPH